MQLKHHKSLYLAHLNDPKFILLEKPDRWYSDCHVEELKIGSSSIRLYLNIVSDEIIFAGYQCPVDLKLHPYFSIFCEHLQGQSIEQNFPSAFDLFGEDEEFKQLIKKGEVPFFDPAIFLFERIQKKYFGTMELPQQNMVCSCFNISRLRLFQFLQKKPQVSMNELCEKTKATLACGECTRSVEFLRNFVLKKDNQKRQLR